MSFKSGVKGRWSDRWWERRCSMRWYAQDEVNHSEHNEVDKSHTHVDAVQTVLERFTNSRDIYWNHTMKALGSHVTFVSSSSLHVVDWSNIHFDFMKMWSRMFAVNVQRVSVHHVNWDFIVWFLNDL